LSIVDPEAKYSTRFIDNMSYENDTMSFSTLTPKVDKKEYDMAIDYFEVKQITLDMSIVRDEDRITFADASVKNVYSGYLRAV